jgi:hypothetical protein
MESMQRVQTTVVALLGADESTVEDLRQRPNVAVFQPDSSSEPLVRAVAAWNLARRTHATYFVHDADPLAGVADAWGRYFAGSGPGGELEVAVTEVVSRWRAGTVELPDYYLVCSPETWSPTLRHWYLGVLAGASANRVVTVATPSEAAPKLEALPAGRWWPDLDRLLTGIDRVVPDQAGLPADEERPSLWNPGGSHGSG